MHVKCICSESTCYSYTYICVCIRICVYMFSYIPSYLYILIAGNPFPAATWNRHIQEGDPQLGGGVSCDQHIYATDDDNAMWILLCIYIDMYIYVMCMSIVCVFMCTCVLMDVGIINICMYICTHTQSYIYVYTNRCQRNADTVIAISRFCYAWL